jgi:nitrilase
VGPDDDAIRHVVVGPDDDGSTAVPQVRSKAVFDKIHICNFGVCSEATFFEAGDTPCVFDAFGFTVGLLICADIRSPELSRLLVAEYGCTVILHPVAFARDESFASYHHFAVTRALENQVYWVSVNYSGDDFGGSISVPPMVGSPGWEQPTTLGNEEGALCTVVRQAMIAKAREAYPFLKHAKFQYKSI